MSATRIPLLSRSSLLLLLLLGSSAGARAAAPLIQTNRMGNIPESHPQGSKTRWNLSTPQKSVCFHRSRPSRASRRTSSKPGMFYPSSSPSQGNSGPGGVWDPFTCEEHGEPGVDVLHLQLQQARGAPAARGTIAAVEGQQLQQLLTLAPAQQLQLPLGAGITPGDRRGTGRAQGRGRGQDLPSQGGFCSPHG